MDKKLKKYTIIPKELYVNRPADNQLITIIKEMERPGYVLVARQMGKTNLLFNAKRTLESTNRIFAYVDLSNYYELEKDCYRNIVDCIVETNRTHFKMCEDEIKKYRSEELPPHKEYSKSLRYLLKNFVGDLIIILDEIDALRSASYSDHIFAQIRSTYFARTNFEEFNRVSYILSGVIEPRDLIKDRNKSPFNIGEKIYLSDFTLEEHNDFIKKSRLQISEETSYEVFKWVNGNPRLTFDICSELENKIINGEEVNNKAVVDIIVKRYLTDFDISPIDHIRELVKSNSSVRKAVYNIQRGENVNNEEVKQKLYLYGITKSISENNLKIKNRIIEESLSLDWIEQINKQTTSQLTYGLEKIESKEYIIAINALKEALEHQNLNREQKELCHYNLGYAYYMTGENEEAIKYFSKDYELESLKDNAYSHLGFSYIKIGKKEKGIEILENVINLEKDNYVYANALLNLGQQYLAHLPERSEKLLHKLITFTQTSKLEEYELNQFRMLSYYYLAELKIKANDDIKDVLNFFRLSKKYANKSDSLALLYFEYVFDEEKKNIILENIVNIIIKNSLKFDSKNLYPVNFNENYLLLFLVATFENNNNLFNVLMEYAVNSIYSSKNKYEILFLMSNLETDSKREILDLIISEYEEHQNQHLLFNSVKNYLIITPDIILSKDTDSKKYFEKYLQILNSHIEKIDFDDIIICASFLKAEYEFKLYHKGIELFKLIENRFVNLPDELYFDSLILYYWATILYFSIGKNKEAALYSEKTLDIIKNSQKKHSTIIDEKGLQAISNNLEQIRNPQKKGIIRNRKKYGRNERIKVKYKDGRIVENKYKRLESDIQKEICKIFE